MATIRSLDMMTVDDLFIKDGYVLNFSDATFARFFAEELNVNINAEKYYAEGGSKGKRLRYFFRTEDNALAIKALKALWNYREMLRTRAGEEEKLPNAQPRFLELLARLGDVPAPIKPQPGASGAIDCVRYVELQTELVALGAMSAQARGFGFEKYLKRLFDVFGLEARSAFRLGGEQIDGSFLLGEETYLLEAKWQNERTGIGDLHAFHGKVEQKAAWARGLFISYIGFSDQALQAFGRGKRVICLDGADLAEAFSRELALSEVLSRKVRRAAETGVAFVRVRDLF
ncbi:restriction endonuclease [Bradyrhizobium sp. 141]|nr:restriction endonuclease [Bradyrhizobium sp. 141]